MSPAPLWKVISWRPIKVQEEPSSPASPFLTTVVGEQSAQHNTRGSLNLEIVGRAIGPDPIDKIRCDPQMRERLRILAANIGAKSL